MAVNPKERKQKKEIAKQIMDFYGEKYNDWLHKKHTEYIDEHLMDYMKKQNDVKKQEENHGEQETDYPNKEHVSNHQFNQ